MSPRAKVRVAAVDAYGHVLNEYRPGADHSVNGDIPQRPWAVYLAGTDRQFRLIGFDFDAKTEGSAPAAARDAQILVDLLGEVGLPAVVCESGPSGGRHVWTALTEGVEADVVGTLARLARGLCPSLDIAPLTNPITGCLRPPGAPHRSGGASTVLSGDTSTLAHPTGTPAQVKDLVARLALLVGDVEPSHSLDARTPVPVDEHGRLHLPGPRRELSAISAAALVEDAASGDASAVLWRVLMGAAAAKWRYAEIAALVDTKPGLEHIRTYRERSERKRRGHEDAQRLLRRQWDKAVTYVATNPREGGQDPTFDIRAYEIASHVRAVQAKADAAGGRWVTGAGPSHRRVLDVLSVLALQALDVAVEADIRRLALLAGIGRETARMALWALAADGWVARVAPAEGPHGATWSVRPGVVIHSATDIDRSQVDPRPAVGTGIAERSLLLTDLTSRTAASVHDVFSSSPGLGVFAGNVFARLGSEMADLGTVCQLVGVTSDQALSVLERLVAAGIVLRSKTGWRRPKTDRRRKVSRQLGVDGRLAARARTYHLERQLWGWWLAEEAWMKAPRRLSMRSRPGPGQLGLLPEVGTNIYGAHPRTVAGRADYRQARVFLESSAVLDVVSVTSPAPVVQHAS
ncbi:hypothetical protein K0651_13125 [Ornithinimicrobium sp. Arc0846-15]|nr:hypothetical protein [Ornithinimicrobium laminariae]